MLKATNEMKKNKIKKVKLNNIEKDEELKMLNTTKESHERNVLKYKY